MNIKDLFTREDGCLSEGRVTSLATFALWVIVTLFLCLKNQTWGHYEAFSAICFGYGVRQYFNKKVEISAGLGQPQVSDEPKPAVGVAPAAPINQPGTKGASI